MRLLAASLIVLAGLLCTNTAEPKEATQPDRIRVLLVTGVDYEGHHWRETAPALCKVLMQNRRLEVRVVEDPDFLASPAVGNYDVIFLHFKNYAPLPHEAAARENLVKLVKQGKGLVVFHFACGAFEDWPEFADLAGKVWDHTAHDPRGPFTVRIIDPQHPVTQKMRDFQADDELYTCLAGNRPVQLLAVAHSKLTGKDHPMAFAFEYGRGRVFHTPLGHDARAIEMPGVAELVRRGCIWAAGRQP